MKTACIYIAIELSLSSGLNTNITEIQQIMLLNQTNSFLCINYQTNAKELAVQSELCVSGVTLHEVMFYGERWS